VTRPPKQLNTDLCQLSAHTKTHTWAAHTWQHMLESMLRFLLLHKNPPSQI